MICGHAPQSGESFGEKQFFSDVLKYEWDLVMCMGDFNGHIGRHMDAVDWVPGGYGVGERIL